MTSVAKPSNTNPKPAPAPASSILTGKPILITWK